ncbi:MAG: metalloregulator ArsR/SmtB family transcription factor [Pseudomonadota bacterium]
MNNDGLSAVFSALSDDTRRHMITQLAGHEHNVRALTEKYAISQPAISKHLRILEKAGLVTRTKSGRETIVRIEPAPLKQVTDWIDFYTRHWQDQFDAVDAYLSKRKQKIKGNRAS